MLLVLDYILSSDRDFGDVCGAGLEEGMKCWNVYGVGLIVT